MQLFSGAADIRIPLGLGCSDLQLGLEKNVSRRILFEALDAGIQYFDTSPRYNLSERFLGQFLPKSPSIILATKVGLDPIIETLPRLIADQLKVRAKSLVQKRPRLREISSDPASPTEIYPKKLLENSIQNSMKNLKTDSLDLLLVHEPERLINLQEVIGWIDAYIEKGIVRRSGLAVHRPGSNLTQQPLPDNLIWQFPWRLRKTFAEHQYSQHIVFGAASMLYEKCPVKQLEVVRKRSAKRLILIKTRNIKHLQWIRKLT